MGTPAIQNESYGQDRQLSILLNKAIAAATGLTPTAGADSPRLEPSADGTGQVINLGSWYRGDAETAKQWRRPRDYIVKLTMTQQDYGENRKPQRITIAFAPGAGDTADLPSEQLHAFLSGHNIRAELEKDPNTAGRVTLTYDNELLSNLTRILPPDPSHKQRERKEERVWGERGGRAR